MKRSRGFSLAELLVAIGVLTIFLDAAQVVFVSVIKSYRELSSYDAQSSALTVAMSRLRADCWQATQLDVQARSVNIQTSGGQQITWKIADDQSMQRTQDQQATSYEQAGQGLSFAADGSLLLLITQAPDGARSVPMVSQAMRLAGGAP